MNVWLLFQWDCFTDTLSHIYQYLYIKQLVQLWKEHRWQKMETLTLLWWVSAFMESRLFSSTVPGLNSFYMFHASGSYQSWPSQRRKFPAWSKPQTPGLWFCRWRRRWPTTAGLLCSLHSRSWATNHKKPTNKPTNKQTVIWISFNSLFGDTSDYAGERLYLPIEYMAMKRTADMNSLAWYCWPRMSMIFPV